MSENGFAIAWTAASRRPLKLGLEGMRSARRGDYRVIDRVDDHARQVIVVAIEHRSDLYRPRL